VKLAQHSEKMRVSAGTLFYILLYSVGAEIKINTHNLCPH